MPIIRLPRRLSLAPLALPALNSLLALAAGLCLAYWAWQAWASAQAAGTPSVGLPMPVVASVSAAPAVAAHFFSPATGEAAKARGDFRLVGTFAGARGRPGVAIIVGSDGRPASFPKGAEIAPGVVLQEIAADHVLLGRDGVSEKLELPAKSSANLIVPVPR